MGHPIGGDSLSDIVAQVVKGDFDIKAAAERAAKQKADADAIARLENHEVLAADIEQSQQLRGLHGCIACG